MAAKLKAELFASDAMIAQHNGMWYNSRITPGCTHGPVSGDAITESIAYNAAHRAISDAAGRPALEIAAR